MKLICEAAEDRGLPGNSLLLLFTKSAWLTKRAIFKKIRAEMLSNFEEIGGVLVNGSEFFQVKGSWPVAFTMWQYRGKNAALNASRPVALRDLTWLTRKRLASIRWDDESAVECECENIYGDPRAVLQSLGEDRVSIREWTGETMVDFKRSRRKVEISQGPVGGLPLGDPRSKNKKAYGEAAGEFIGFMDNLTPCRVRRSVPDRPWFRLNNQFADIKKNRCLSGPPDNRGYCAKDLTSAKRLFFWYSLARTFVQHPYPMWADSDDMWDPMISPQLEDRVYQSAFAIGYAENECVTITFPSGNPVAGAPELVVRNPMSPLDQSSFWSATLKPFCSASPSADVCSLIHGVDDLYMKWSFLFRARSELPISPKPYLLDAQGLTVGAGLIQIIDYARETSNSALLQRIGHVQARLKIVRKQFFDLVTSGAAINYFGPLRKPPSKELKHSRQRKVL